MVRNKLPLIESILKVLVNILSIMVAEFSVTLVDSKICGRRPLVIKL